MDDDNLDDLELELRMLPGVRAAGFDTQDDVLFVQLHMADSPAEPETMSATRIAARHAADRSVAVEIARWRTYVPPAPAEVTDADVYVDLSSDLPLVAPMVEKAQTELWGGPPYPPRTMVEVKRLFDDDIVEIDSVFYAPVKK